MRFPTRSFAAAVVSAGLFLPLCGAPPSKGPEAAKGQPQTHSQAVDPVCGMTVDPAKAAGKSEYKGVTHYFCSDYCKRKFDAAPEAVLKKPAPKK